MKQLKCPKCGAEVTDFWANQRRQLVGKCKTCKRMVNLGRSEESSKEESGKEKPEHPAKKTTKRGTTSASNRSAAGKAAKGNERGPVRQPKPVQQTAGDAGDDFLSKLFKRFF